MNDERRPAAAPDNDHPVETVAGWLEWKPHPGDTLAGVVTINGTWHDPFGNAWPTIAVDTGGGREVVVIARPMLLRIKLDHHAPAVGDRIIIRYDGMRDGKLKMWSLRVLHRGAFDWDQLAEEDREAA